MLLHKILKILKNNKNKNSEQVNNINNIISSLDRNQTQAPQILQGLGSK